MFDIFSPFIIGFLGSVHCLGMCGPLVLAYSFHIKSQETNTTVHAAPPWKRVLLHHIAFHSGRLLSYGFLGVLAAGLFQVIGFSRLFTNLRGGVTLLSGTLMVLLGFVLLKVLPLPAFLASFPTGTVSWKRLVSSLLTSERLGSRIILGLGTGFLPCGLSLAMIIKAAATENLVEGLLTMVSFALGTVPALFLPGFSASFLSLKTRILGERTAALSVVAMGLILVFKGGRTFA